MENTMIPTKEEMREALEARHGRQEQEKIFKACVAVCGLGGLGSNIAISLARCGIGKLILIDFDQVDLPNLNRQQYKICQIGQDKTQALQEEIREIAPYVQTKIHTVKLTEGNIPELLQEADYICEAFDHPVQKAMLTNTVLEKLPEKYLVGASGMAGVGDSNQIITRRITSKYYLCGDGISESKPGGGLMAPRVMLCAAHQANKVLELIIQNSLDEIK